VVAGKITLMSSAFGRGTDFLLLDEKVKAKGGLHVIQVFLSVDES
jgi:preprotein translocase subunit SecA